MKFNLRKTAAMLLAMLCLMAPALAQSDLSVALNVSVTAEGTLPDPAETYIIRMTADDAAFPMPEGQVGGSYDLAVTGPGDAAFPAIEYDRLGIYSYQIQQVPGDYPDAKYDAAVYTLKVSVINAENGGFAIEVALRQDGQAEKMDAASFHNVYKIIIPPTTEPGTITPTGVNDYWMYYLGGSALLLVAAGFIAGALLRKEESDEAEVEA